MADLDPRIQRVRRIGLVVLIGLAIAAVPIGVNIIQTRQSPGLWLALLGGVFLMVIICLYALETALAPIPERKVKTPVTIPPDGTELQEDTLLDEPPEVLAATEMIEPEVCFSDPEGEESEVVSLVEVEEFPTHPPVSPSSDLSDQDTELDLERPHSTNPDGPLLTVPNPALRNAELTESVDAESEEKTET